MIRKTFFLAILLISAAAAFAQERYVKPVDEARQDASFLAFRTKLIAAAERKDINYVIRILDPGIELSFGGQKGVADFREMWTGKNESEFWREFLPVIKGGGQFVGEGRNRFKHFSAPYVFTAEFPSSCDPYECAAIIGSGVNLRESPNVNAKVIGQLSYNVVKCDEAAAVKKKTGPNEWDWIYDWHKVTTLGGRTGWVKAEFVRNPFSFRAGFEKKRGVWKMTFFIGGD